MAEPLIWSLTTEQTATSTSDLAKLAAAGGAPPGSAFLAVEQTAGRGRHGRSWSSQKGGMYLSVLLRPPVDLSQWFALSFAASLAVLETVRAQIEAHMPGAHMPQTGLKWPNDVMLAGGKIAGILLEVDGQNLIIGSGINIAPVGAVGAQRIAPVALADIWPIDRAALPSPHDLAAAYIDRLAVWYESFCQSGFAPIRTAWLQNALFLGQQVAVARGETMISGVFHDLGMDGTMLLLDDSGQTHHIGTGDVKLLGS
ncbi:MAG: biotin--[acetyl-CoA-carboxylase] ligase [Candidatus Puniceispirillum sp.]|nr:biotin--[acetyl-CoA-carboxylase] ligase [Candidatus Puniceispirillum sp.]MBL6774308.1 biotin--[acetyl-CoA-carboxylase] ligase [Candidatus Puniceispirillum sp.]